VTDYENVLLRSLPCLSAKTSTTIAYSLYSTTKHLFVYEKQYIKRIRHFFMIMYVFICRYEKNETSFSLSRYGIKRIKRKIIAKTVKEPVVAIKQEA